MDARIRKYLKQPYSRILIPDSENGRYAAQILEFAGCFSEGPTPQKAYKNLEQAAYNWLESAINQGMAVPAPFSAEGFSGRIALRLPKSLHRQAMNLARRDGVSLNQFLVSAVAASVSAETLYTRIVDRLETRLVGKVFAYSTTLTATVAHPTTGEMQDFEWLKLPAANMPILNVILGGSGKLVTHKTARRVQ